MKMRFSSAIAVEFSPAKSLYMLQPRSPSLTRKLSPMHVTT